MAEYLNLLPLMSRMVNLGPLAREIGFQDGDEFHCTEEPAYVNVTFGAGVTGQQEIFNLTGAGANDNTQHIPGGVNSLKLDRYHAFLVQKAWFQFRSGAIADRITVADNTIASAVQGRDANAGWLRPLSILAAGPQTVIDVTAAVAEHSRRTSIGEIGGSDFGCGWLMKPEEQNQIFLNTFVAPGADVTGRFILLGLSLMKTECASSIYRK